MMVEDNTCPECGHLKHWQTCSESCPCSMPWPEPEPVQDERRRAIVGDDRDVEAARYRLHDDLFNMAPPDVTWDRVGEMLTTLETAIRVPLEAEVARLRARTPNSDVIATASNLRAEVARYMRERTEPERVIDAGRALDGALRALTTKPTTQGAPAEALEALRALADAAETAFRRDGLAMVLVEDSPREAYWHAMLSAIEDARAVLAKTTAAPSTVEGVESQP